MAQKTRAQLALLSETADTISSSWASDVYDSLLALLDDNIIADGKKIFISDSSLWIEFIGTGQKRIVIGNPSGMTLTVGTTEVSMRGGGKQITIDNGGNINVDGNNMSFYGVPNVARATALTVANNNSRSANGALGMTANDGEILENMRTRINELETKIKAYGLLQ